MYGYNRRKKEDKTNYFYDFVCPAFIHIVYIPNKKKDQSDMVVYMLHTKMEKRKSRSKRKKKTIHIHT